MVVCSRLTCSGMVVKLFAADLREAGLGAGVVVRCRLTNGGSRHRGGSLLQTYL